MNRKLYLNTLRSVGNTKSRFFAILAIIAIGSGFFAGVKSAGPDMKLSSAQYLEEQGLADIHIISTLGLDDEDLAAVENCNISDELYAGYSFDLMVKGGELNQKIVKVYSYDPDSKINIPYLVEGRLPQAADEIIADERFFSAETPDIGDKIVLETGDDREMSDYLSNTEFTIVGKAKSPIYIAYERGSTTVGNGVINGWFLIPEENFCSEVYTDIYVSLFRAKGVDPYTDEYEDIVDRNIKVLENLAETQIEHRKSVILDEAYEEINDAKDELADGEKELADAEQELRDAEQEIADGEAEIADNVKKLEDAEKEIADGQAELDDGESEYNDGLAALDELRARSGRLGTVIADYSVNAGDADRVSAVIDSLNEGEYFTVDETLEQLLTAYIMMPAAYDDGTKTMAGQGIGQYAAGLTAQADELETTLANSRIQLDDAQKELDDARAEVADGWAEIEDARKEIEDAKKEVEDGWAEVEDGKKELEDARQEIADAEQEIHDAVDDAEWYVFNRDDYNPYYSHYAEDCERVDAIAAVFPIFFIMVAALVCCTTMTRMVEEQRTQIGTLKALGYSRFTIISQYIIYALAASIPGGFLGLLIGFATLPRVIFVCYQSMYSQPYLVVPFRWSYAVGCITAACLCTGLSALYASRQELVSCPAQLMRPKPPKDGKRILLERITFIWNRLKFTTKVTYRNLFRYKSRLLMTIIGIAGCTALLLTGFGLRESISAIVDLQYGNIFKYDALAALDDTIDEDGYAAVMEDCDSSGNVTEKMLVMQINTDIYNVEGDTFETYLMVPEDPSELGRFIDLHTRQEGEKLELGSGVILGEKLARFLDVTAGDSVYFGKGNPVRVDAVCENYTFNYAYMSPEVYKKAGAKDALKNNILLLNMNDPSLEDELSEILVKNENVLAVSYSAAGGDKFRDLVSSLSMIVLAIIVSAGALAFVVLFNLSNININERVRELATIKVLGFFDGEVAAYIYRENILSTFMGTAAGLILGIFLEKFVIKTAEVDAVMFAVGIPVFCFLAAAAMTLFFAFVVNLTLYFRLKKIDMATSLKAIE
ncbi:MAG: FtsX-like permease family protein [Oscillospiraceae bacterium]|nr:FtsX-like permease family protein [Oscillospiraceae bacterium]